MIILKILRAEEWAALRKGGSTKGAPIDLEDGYIHFSTPEQAPETASKHFAGIDGLMLLGCEADDFGDTLKWEVSRGGAKFPHLYDELKMDAVILSLIHI